MEGFLKTNGSAPIAPRLNGYQKIAVLLGELGMDAGQTVLSRLKLTDAELIAIRKEMQALGYYNPHNQFQVMREYSVLNEVADFGIARGIYREVPHVTPAEQKRQERVDNLSKQNPEDIAKFLRMMLETKN